MRTIIIIWQNQKKETTKTLPVRRGFSVFKTYDGKSFNYKQLGSAMDCYDST